MSGHGNVETAVRATKLGAVDFIEKPFSIDGLLGSIRRALRSSGDELGSHNPVAASRRAAEDVDGPSVAEKTLSRSVVGGGQGLHSGVRTGLILHPLPPASGIRFGSVAGENDLAYITGIYK